MSPIPEHCDPKKAQVAQAAKKAHENQPQENRKVGHQEL